MTQQSETTSVFDGYRVITNGIPSSFEEFNSAIQRTQAWLNAESDRKIRARGYAIDNDGNIYVPDTEPTLQDAVIVNTGVVSPSIISSMNVEN